MEMATAPSSQSSPAPPPPPQQQIGSSLPAPASATAATPAPSSTRLSFDEVAKHFNVPIAEAATALGVCSSVLKRICRENGVIRWPYRKFLAGKTVDDIKKDAAREKGKEFAELSRIARERLDQAANTHPALIFPASTLVTGHTQEASKLQRGFSLSDHAPQQQGIKLFQDGHSVFQPLYNVPNYVDEFKYGFPAGGLSSATPQWWGSCTRENAEENLQSESLDEDRKLEPDKSSPSSPNKTGEPGNECRPVSLLCSMRRKAVIDGQESHKLGVSRGYGHYKLGKRERSILTQVFKSSLPCQWKYCFS